ncbi:hypothetical protein [Klebsiella aerogenes]|uniref:hypothetical protein n=1 Tax=Klebsiella aerogenes TaxID=548 RepID=UPI00062C2204|nr:hypothetical protein [Klebsiella aerogenes]KKY64132.1 hypothetical protein OA41_20300 [Klebsiella aerogenes]
MKLNDYAASVALENGGFLMAGNTNIKRGDVIEVTHRAGLKVTSVDVKTLADVPVAMVMSACRHTPDGWQPFYSDVVYETAYQAAYAQLMNDGGRGFDVDDVLDWQSLDEPVTVVSVKQVTNYANQQ